MDASLPEMEEGQDKQYALLILALLYDLEETEAALAVNNLKNAYDEEAAVGFEQTMETLLNELNSLELPKHVDECFLQRFTRMADCLSKLSDKVNELRGILARIQAGEKPADKPGALVLQ